MTTPFAEQICFPFEEERLEEGALRRGAEAIKRIERAVPGHDAARDCWDRLWLGNVDEGALGLPCDLELAWDNKYSYTLCVEEKTLEIYPVFRDYQPDHLYGLGCGLTVWWFLRGVGVSDPGWVFETLHEAQDTGVARMRRYFALVIEAVRIASARTIEKRLDRVARGLTSDEDVYRRVRPKEGPVSAEPVETGEPVVGPPPQADPRLH